MRRVWASVAAVWATIAIFAALVWTRPAPAPTPQPTPTTFVVKGKNGTTRLVVASPAPAVHATTHASPRAGMNALRLYDEAFRAMGTTCSVAATASPRDARRAGRALAAGRAEVDACERVLSRFDPASDLSRLNEAAGEWVTVDERLVEALAAALRAREVTGGRFDPTILPALVAAGYDRSFEQLEPRPARTAAGWRRRGARRGRPGRRASPRRRGRGRRPRRDRKGLLRRRAYSPRCASAWPTLLGGLVDLGGDIALWGRPPGGGPWRIAVADPRSPGAHAAACSSWRGGGVATSGRHARRFGPGGALHHLIDPARALPAVGGPLAVTVVGPDAAGAEAHATALAIGDARRRPGAARRTTATSRRSTFPKSATRSRSETCRFAASRHSPESPRERARAGCLSPGWSRGPPASSPSACSPCPSGSGSG